MLHSLAISVLVIFGLFAAFGAVISLAYVVSLLPDAIDDALEAIGFSETAITNLWAVFLTGLGLAAMFLLAAAIAPFVLS